MQLDRSSREEGTCPQDPPARVALESLSPSFGKRWKGLKEFARLRTVPDGSIFWDLGGRIVGN